MDSEILFWWLEKYSPQIINYINMVVQFEEMTMEALEKRRKHLLLEYLDSSDSVILPYLLGNVPSFLETLYDAIYKTSLIRDSV